MSHLLNKPSWLLQRASPELPIKNVWLTPSSVWTSGCCLIVLWALPYANQTQTQIYFKVSISHIYKSMKCTHTHTHLLACIYSATLSKGNGKVAQQALENTCALVIILQAQVCTKCLYRTSDTLLLLQWSITAENLKACNHHIYSCDLWKNATPSHICLLPRSTRTSTESLLTPTRYHWEVILFCVTEETLPQKFGKGGRLNIWSCSMCIYIYIFN